MADITSPAPDSSVDCTFTVKGTCSGAFTFVAKNSAGNPIPGTTKSPACQNGKFKVEITVCGVSTGDTITLEVTDGGGTSRIQVTLNETCPAC